MFSLKKETGGSAASKQSENDIHPSFNDLNADIILISSEGTHFRVHSRTLSLASSWFCALLSLPQGSTERKSHMRETKIEKLALLESTRVVAMFLSIITYQPIPALDTFEFVSELLHAGEKYEMPTVVSVVRLAIMSPPLLDAHPIRAYGIASGRGWIAEAKLASTKTISLDLLSPECSEELATVNSRHLIALMLLHRRRRDKFWEGLNDTDVFIASSGVRACSQCGFIVSHARWNSAKHEWREMLETKPADVVSKAFLYQEALQDVLKETCGRCCTQLYTREATLQNLNILVDTLPIAVEM